MAFNQYNLERVHDQSRGGFDLFVYHHDTDTIADITASGYFDETKFGFKSPGNNPKLIKVQCADGPYEVQLVGGVVSVVGNSVTPSNNSNITSLLVSAIDKGFCVELSGVDTVYIDPDAVTIPDGKSLSLKSSTDTSIIPTSAGNYAISMSDASKLFVEGIKFDSSTIDCGFLYGLSATSGKYLNLDMYNCEIDVSGGNGNGVDLNGYKRRVRVYNSVFIGNENPDLTGNFYDTQTLLAIPDNGVEMGNDTLISIKGNEFRYGAMQYSTYGTDSPNSPLVIDGNLFVEASMRAMHVYHGEDALIQNNTVIGCKGKRPGNEFESIGGAIFLDLYGPLVDGSRDGHVYSNNIVRGCAGVGVFMEEVTGTLSGWTVTDTEIFPDSYTYVGNDGFVTAGGFGFVITGGNRRITLNIRADGNRSGVVIDHSLGVSTKPPITVVELLNCNIDSNFEHGILIRNEAKVIKILNGTCVNNGRETDNTYDAIHIERDDTDSLANLYVHNVTFDDLVTTVHHRHCIGKAYPGMYASIKDNIFNSLSNYVDSGGTMTGDIKENKCIGGRSFTISGSDRWFYNNNGYRSEYGDKITVTGGFIEWTYPTLHAGSAQRVSAPTFLGGADIGRYELELLTNKLSLRLFDSAGAQLVTDVDVCLQVASSKSTAL